MDHTWNNLQCSTSANHGCDQWLSHFDRENKFKSGHVLNEWKVGEIVQVLDFKGASLVEREEDLLILAKTYHAALTPPCQHPPGQQPDLQTFNNLNRENSALPIILIKESESFFLESHVGEWGSAWIKICGVKLTPWAEIPLRPRIKFKIWRVHQSTAVISKIITIITTTISRLLPQYFGLIYIQIAELWSILAITWSFLSFLLKTH